MGGFDTMVKSTLSVSAPNDVLEAGVVLVDLPGFDQEKEYLDEFQKYMDRHPVENIVMVYLLDVKNKLLNSDREFFAKLGATSWQDLLGRCLTVFVNKCDPPTN